MEITVTKIHYIALSVPVQLIASDVRITVVFRQLGIAMAMTTAAMDPMNRPSIVNPKAEPVLGICSPAIMEIVYLEFIFVTAITTVWIIRTKMLDINVVCITATSNIEIQCFESFES